MKELLGIPVETLMWVFSGALAIVILWSIFVVLRQPVLFRLAARNIPRRAGRSMLIVLGLTLATTIITAALATGDTVTTTARTSVLDSLGNIDEVISPTGESDIEITGEGGQARYFDEAAFKVVQAALGDSSRVDGVMPVIAEDVGAQDLTTRQTEPRIAVMAMDARYTSGFGDIRNLQGQVVRLDGLAADAVYLNRDAAEELRASPGDQLAVHASGQSALYTVADIVDYESSGTGDAGMLMLLSSAQRLFNKPGQIEHILISNDGGHVSGMQHTDAVTGTLSQTLAGLGLSIEATKRDDLATADAAGTAFSSFFVTFGSFSIAAGVLLIFLLFVMLAGERRPEMGMARAVGTERRHLIEMFMLEGLLYDLAAAGIGALAGVAVAYAMVFGLSTALGDFGTDLQFSVSGRSMITAYAMGVVLTFIVVTLSAWRVSVLNIVSAIRNLPEPATRTHGRASLVWGIVAMLAGALSVWSGLGSGQAAPVYLGVSLLIFAAIPLLRWRGVSDRLAFGVGGGLTVIWWLLPSRVLDPVLPELSVDFNIWILGGLITVTGATWLVIYNSDLALGFGMRFLGRFRGLAPVLKTAITYPLTNRFRTGVTLAMFTLVVFVLVVGSITTTAFTAAFNDIDLYGGGFDIRAGTVAANPLDNAAAEIQSNPDLGSGDYDVVASQSVLAIEAKQTGSERAFGDYPIRGVDDAFLDNTTYGFGLIANGYGSPTEVWQALKANPDLAVVDSLVAPRRARFSFGAVVPDFQMEGFYIEDGEFEPTRIEVRDPATGETRNLTVIAILKDVVPTNMIGITTSQRSIDASFPGIAAPTTHLIRLRSGSDADASAARLESAFLPNGLEAVVLSEELHDVVSLNETFNYLVQAFVGLGLVVGVAALGVVSARSVIERRQEIGVMRAIGFEQGRVQASFLIESSMVAIAGIVLGTALGLVIAFNVISDSSEEASWENLHFVVPWLNLAIIYCVVMAAAMITSFFPARQASRVYPAQALRYE